MTSQTQSFGTTIGQQFCDLREFEEETGYQTKPVDNGESSVQIHGGDTPVSMIVTN